MTKRSLLEIEEVAVVSRRQRETMSLVHVLLAVLLERGAVTDGDLRGMRTIFGDRRYGGGGPHANWIDDLLDKRTVFGDA